MNRSLALVAGVCLALQVLSATVFVRNFETPNVSSTMARHLVRTGELAYQESRAYHLPGEALYLALGFRLLPESAWRFLHVPVTVLLVVCVAAVALIISGPALALFTGIAMSLEPFILAHGPVWDDTFLAAALEWSIFALLFATLVNDARPATHASAGRRLAVCCLMAVCAAAAAVTRLEAQLLLGIVAALAITVKSLRAIRSSGWAIAAGVCVGLSVWGVRNAVAIDHFLVGSTQDGKTLEESTGPRALEAIFINGQAGGSSDTAVDARDEVAADRQLARIAWRYILTHPFDFFRTAAIKLIASLLGIDFGREIGSWRNVAALGSSVLLLTAGPYGLWSLRRHLTMPPVAMLTGALVAGTALLTVVLLMLGPVGLRYRLDLSMWLGVGVGVTCLRVCRTEQQLSSRT